jgi:acyl dehydratase
MSEAGERAYKLFSESVGSVEGAGEWFTIDQQTIDAFAKATLDFAFIHVDPEAAKAGPFGETIAHGFLTLSMLPHLTLSVTSNPERSKGVKGGVNYGFNKIRFVSPVRVNSRIRATVSLLSVEQKGDQLEITRGIVVEIEGSDRPALTAEWIVRNFY